MCDPRRVSQEISSAFRSADLFNTCTKLLSSRAKLFDRMAGSPKQLRPTSQNRDPPVSMLPRHESRALLFVRSEAGL